MVSLWLLSVHLFCLQLAHVAIVGCGSVDGASELIDVGLSYNQLTDCLNDRPSLPGNEDSERSIISLVEGPETSSEKSVLSKIGAIVSKTVAPVQSYASLINRYRIWYKTYKALEELSPRALKDPTEALRGEYARADESLLQERCQDPTDTTQSLDYIFEVLRRTIDLLEKQLDVLKSEESLDDDDLDIDEDGIPVQADEERVKLAMSRLKTILLSKAKSVVANEANIVARLAVLNSLANAAKYQQDSASSVGLFSHFIGLIGGTSGVSVVSCYLLSIETRIAFAVAGLVDPMKLVKCFWRGKQ